MFAPSLLGMLFSTRDHGGLSWRDLAEGRLRLDRLSRNGGGSTFFPWSVHPAWHAPRGPRPAHSSRAKKLSPPPSSAALRPARGASSIAFGLQIAIEAAVVAGSTPTKET